MIDIAGIVKQALNKEIAAGGVRPVSGGDINDGAFTNAAGNHIGSWHARLDWKARNWSLGLYMEHMFEDQSQMFMQYGFEEFFKMCVECGVSGAIIPDLPFADYQELKPLADKYDIRIIMLITPETSDERIRFIDDNTDGFIYMVSSASTTGAQKSFDEQKQEYFQRINSMNLRNPRMIGFGISNKQTLETSQQNAAGAIIGSKFVQLLEEAGGDADKAINKLYEALEK